MCAIARLRPGLVLAAAMLALMVLSPVSTNAQYFKRPVSNIDPRIMLFDEGRVLGNKIDPSTVLIDQNGKEFVWGDVLGKPVILVLAYYSCDGSCSIINDALRLLLKDVKQAVPGKDFSVLTLSFDRHDNIKTTTAFRKNLDLEPALAEHWTFATFKNEEDLRTQTEKIGFKFFWVPEDRLFLHPGAFLFFSPDGRLVRVLYQYGVDATDVTLAVLDARQGQFRPSEVINLAISLCYSYNYEDGKYHLSIPIFVGLGALLIGVTTFAGAATYFVRKKKRLDRGKCNAEAV